MGESQPWLSPGNADVSSQVSPHWWLKGWLKLLHLLFLQRPRAVVPSVEEAPEEQACQCGRPSPRWRGLLLAVCVLLVGGAMLLLLLWNYQCIYVWRLCLEEYAAIPRLGEPGEEQQG